MIRRAPATSSAGARPLPTEGDTMTFAQAIDLVQTAALVLIAVVLLVRR